MSRAPRRQREHAPVNAYTASPLRRATVLLTALNVLVLCVVFDPFGQESFELPKSLASRAVEWLTIGSLAVLVLRFGWSIFPRSKVWLAVAAFLAVNALSAIFAADPYTAAFGEVDRYLGLTFTLDMTILAASIAATYRGARDWSTLGAAVLAAWAISTMYAVIQFAGLDPFPWSLSAKARPFATFGNPDIFGQFQSIAFATALGVFLVSSRARRMQALIVALVIVGLVSVIATRGSIIGLVSALVVVPVVLAGLGRLAGIPRRGLLAGVAGAIVVAGLAWVSPLGRRVQSTFAGEGLEDRLVIYQSALREIAARPALGWGPDSFALGYPSSRVERSAYYDGANSLSSSAHDWVLQVAATTGVLGLIAYLALIGIAAWSLFRRGLRERPEVAAPLLLALTAYLGHGLVTVGSVSIDWLPWIAVGAAASLDAVDAPATPRRVPSAALAAITIAAFTGAGSGGILVAANHDAWFAAHNESLARAALAERSALEATALDGGRAVYWSLLGDVRAIGGHYREAANAHLAAFERAPYVAGYLSAAAFDRAHQAMAGDARDGGVDAAFALAERAAALDPYQPVTHATIALIAEMSGQSDRAFAEASRATELYPFAFDDLLARTALHASDRSVARAALVRALTVHETVTLRLALATMDLDAGDRASAIIHVRRALNLDPNNADAKLLAQRLGL